MNKLPRPEVDDAVVLQNLADNEYVGSYPHLQAWVAAIAAGYNQYRAVRGSAVQVLDVHLPNDIRTYLKGHYGSPPKDLAHIERIRQEHRQRVCPMCGSMHSGTLDHILPKDEYSAFAIFSLNLVPACDCNNKRGEATQGQLAGARVLHPYFDECLSERLIAARFDDLGLIPRVNLRLLVDCAHPHYRAISFHVAEIVSKTAILGYWSDSWTNLCQMPEQVIRALGDVPQTEEELREILIRERDMLDRHRKGKNNWESAFVSGLLDEDVLQWLFARLAAPGRLPDGPLV